MAGRAREVLEDGAMAWLTRFIGAARGEFAGGRKELSSHQLMQGSLLARVLLPRKGVGWGHEEGNSFQLRWFARRHRHPNQGDKGPGLVLASLILVGASLAVPSVEAHTSLLFHWARSSFAVQETVISVMMGPREDRGIRGSPRAPSSGSRRMGEGFTWQVVGLDR
eukprot:763600-Hanusia_phi.AAC.5